MGENLKIKKVRNKCEKRTIMEEKLVYTVDDYEEFSDGEAWELVEGEATAMGGIALIPSENLSGKLHTYLHNAIEETDLYCYSRPEWFVNETNVVRPNNVITLEESDDDRLFETPIIIIEDSRLPFVVTDNAKKSELYAKQKVKYYVIVDQDNKKVTINRLTSLGYSEKACEDNCFTFDLDEDTSIEIDFTSFIS